MEYLQYGERDLEYLQYGERDLEYFKCCLQKLERKFVVSSQANSGTLAIGTKSVSPFRGYQVRGPHFIPIYSYFKKGCPPKTLTLKLQARKRCWVTSIYSLKLRNFTLQQCQNIRYTLIMYRTASLLGNLSAPRL